MGNKNAALEAERARVNALYEGAVKFDHRKTYRTVPCRTLGTYWRDIEDEDGNVFAIQVPTELAEAFAKEPWRYGNVFAWIPMLRTWALEAEHRYLYEPKATKKVRKRK